MSSTPRSKIVDADGAPLDDATLAYVFQPMSPELFDDPVCGAELRRLAVADPDIIAAVADVDRTLFDAADQRSPIDRLCAAMAQTESLMAFRRVA
jgi:hypothetical protein